MGESREAVPVVDLSDNVDDVLEEALAAWNPGRSRQERRERRQVGFAVLRWLRADGEVRRRDVIAELFDDLGLEGQSEDTFWRMCARPALSSAADAGFVDASGRTYEWSGSE